MAGREYSATEEPGQLQEYFSQIAGAASKRRREQPAAMPADEVAMSDASVSQAPEPQAADEVKETSEGLKAEILLRYRESASPAIPAPPLLKAQAALSLEAQDELDRQRKEWLRIQKSLEREHFQRKAELEKVRAQWYQTQKELEQESRARRMEGAQASAKIATLERNLRAASEIISNSYRQDVKPAARRNLAIVFASVALVVVAAAGAAWTQFPARAGVPASQGDSAPAAPPPLVSGPGKHLPSGGFAAAQGGTGFQGPMGRLNEALSSFGNWPAEDLLREVRRWSGDRNICPFRWNNGQPALLYGGDGMKQSMADALGSCAAAVEKYRRS